MRARNLKPGFFKNEILCSLEPLARILFEGLWCIADRKGRLEDRPLRIKAEALPYDNCDVEIFLSQLEIKGFIKRYEHNGRKYISILNFLKHQQPHWQEKQSTIPDECLDKSEIKPGVILDKSEIKPGVILDKSRCNPSDLKKGIRESENQESENQESENQESEDVNRFNQFWGAYPKKKSKGDAEKAWKKINLSNRLFKKIMSKIDEAKKSSEWAKDNGQFIPYPASWLNAKGWEDEYIPITPFKPQPGIQAFLDRHRKENKINES